MTRPLEWMRAVRDADPPFTTTRLAVLWALGLRMDSTGRGFASAAQLASDAGVHERTARRAIDEARGRGYLNRTRRGHRLGDGRAVASEWELTLPTQPATGGLSADSQPATGDLLTQSQPVRKCSQPATGDLLTQSQPVRKCSQPGTGDRPRGLSTRGLSASARAAAVVSSHTDATDAEAAAVVALIERERQPRSIAGLVSRFAADGDLAEWLARVRADGRRADMAEWIASLATRPECPHSVPGGDLLRPDTGQPQCPLCRSQRGSTVSKGSADPLTGKERS